MAIIKDVIYCLNTKNDRNDGNVNANGVLSVITPEFVPGSFSFSLVITVLGLGNQPHNFMVEFVDSKGKKLIDTSMLTIPPQNVKTDIPDEYLGINISIDWQNVVFREDGLYNTIITLDGAKYKYPIYVKGKNIL